MIATNNHGTGDPCVSYPLLESATLDGFSHVIKAMKRFMVSAKAVVIELAKVCELLVETSNEVAELRYELKRAEKADHRTLCMVGWDAVVLPVCNLPTQSYSTLPVYQRRFRRHNRVEVTG